jgi:chromosome segregation ATPase
MRIATPVQRAQPAVQPTRSPQPTEPSYDSALREEHAALQRELAAAQRVLEAHKRRAEELESRLNAPSEELALAQMENRAFSKTLDALHTEVSRERAAGEKLRDQLKECEDELRKALIETNRLAAACR